MASNQKADLPAPPSVSIQSFHMTGLLVDVYGLKEISQRVSRVSCLWVHHARKRRKEDMADISARAVAAWNQCIGAKDRGLVALAFDQRNHGTRLVHEPANGSWRAGNITHAQDMFGILSGTVTDQVALLDAVGGYLFLDGGRTIDHHLALGISLGGHSVWQLMLADERIRAGVSVVGCPDYISLLSDRARLSNLSTYSEDDSGASFLGSSYFPPALVHACGKSDPKCIFFNTSPVPDACSSVAQREKWKKTLHDRLRGKKLFLCSGGDDKLVPRRCSQPFLDWLKDATGSQFRELNIKVVDNVYPGIGHLFSADMAMDSIRFIIDVVAGANEEGWGDRKTTEMS